MAKGNPKGTKLRKSVDKDPEQSERFIQAARDAGALEESPEATPVLKRVAQKPQKG